MPAMATTCRPPSIGAADDRRHRGLWSAADAQELAHVPGAAGRRAAVAIAAAAFLGLSQINYVNVPDNIWSVTIFPTPEKLMRITEWPVLLGAISIAFIASAETLLCATAVDQMHRGPRTKYDRELTAQGVGNSICGILGVLPMTGVIVRSSANVEAGAVDARCPRSCTASGCCCSSA